MDAIQTAVMAYKLKNGDAREAREWLGRQVATEEGKFQKTYDAWEAANRGKANRDRTMPPSPPRKLQVIRDAIKKLEDQTFVKSVAEGRHG